MPPGGNRPLFGEGDESFGALTAEFRLGQGGDNALFLKKSSGKVGGEHLSMAFSSVKMHARL